MEQQLSVKEANLGMKEQQLFLKNQEIASLKSDLQLQLGTVTSLMNQLKILRANLAKKEVRKIIALIFNFIIIMNIYSKVALSPGPWLRGGLVPYTCHCGFQYMI